MCLLIFFSDNTCCFSCKYICTYISVISFQFFLGQIKNVFIFHFCRISRKAEWRRTNTATSQSSDSYESESPEKDSSYHVSDDSSYPDNNYELGYHYSSDTSVESDSPGQSSISSTLKKLEKRSYKHSKSRSGKKSSKKVTPKKKRKPTKKPRNLWTPTKEQKLCSLWEDEEFMYNTMSLNYRNRDMRKNTYERFAAIFDTTR